MDQARVAEVLTPRLAIDAIQDWIETGQPMRSQRTAVAWPGADLLIMPAAARDLAGVKLITVAPANPSRGLPRIQGVYQLFDAVTMAPVAALDAVAVTALRTAAVTAVAVDALAPPGPARLVVFGTSVQAESHTRCLAQVRPLESVVIAGRDASRAQALAARLRAAGHPA
ncbi:MAG: hypothetical protein LBD51_04025, partial [Bifidobacteriaceae bacterium]|nr:hypothetical protein [Bifidobacteriaceae bacterium]